MAVATRDPVKVAAQEARAARILALTAKGLYPAQIAARMQCHVTTVTLHLARAGYRAAGPGEAWVLR